VRGKATTTRLFIHTKNAAINGTDMSAGAVFQEVLRLFNLQRFRPIDRRNILKALEAGRPGPLALLYEAGAEAGLSRLHLLRRAAAIYFNFCAINLSDDLSDNECTYLSDPLRTGPCLQAILQSLFFYALAEERLSSRVLTTATQDLVSTGGAQLIELRTRRWTASIFRVVAAGIAGRQWSAHLRILWHGTTLAKRAARVGMNLGVAELVAGDIRSHDQRYTTLPEPDKREIIAWAIVATCTLRKEQLRVVDGVLHRVDPILTKEAAKLSLSFHCR
jgi:hypothetical protein